MFNYKHWYLHRETWEIVAKARNKQDRNIDRMIDMVIDATGRKFNWDMEDDPEASSDEFDRTLRDADELL